MADNKRNPYANNDISCDSNHSGTYSFSYPGNQIERKPFPSTVAKNVPSFRKPVRIIPFMREALKKAEIDGDVKNSSVKIQNCISEAGNADSLLDTVTHLEPMPELDSFSQDAEHTAGSMKSTNEDPNAFRGMGWLMESGQKNRKALTTGEQQLESIPESQLLHQVIPPSSSVNHQYANFSTPQSKHLHNFGVFKEVNNSSALKPRSGMQQSNKTPLKYDLEHIAVQNEKIYSTSSCYSNSKTLYNPAISQFSSARKIIADTNHSITPSNHRQESERHQVDTPFRFKQVLQEIPIKVTTTPGYGCPVKFSHIVGPPRHADNTQDKENDIQLNMVPYGNVETQTDKPLNLNLKDLTGCSDHQCDLKMNTKTYPVESSHELHNAQPIGMYSKSNHSLAELPPKPTQKDIKTDLQEPSPKLDSSGSKSYEPMLPPANSAKKAIPAGNVMFSLPVAKPKNSSLTVNGKPYVIISQLGVGGSSKVYQVMENGSNATYAVKCVDLASVDKAIAQGYMNEIALLKKLQHCDSVIRLFGYEYLKKTKMLLVVMEKGDTDFSNFLRDINKTKKTSALMIAYYWTEMVTAVDNIHKHGIIHSDLKPPNFLLVAGRLKLIDFGIASSINVDMTSVVKDQLMGTFNYMSPEAIGVLNNTGGQQRKITFKSDIWSLGCILYNLVYGRTPFAHINGIGKLVEIFNPQHEIKYPDVDYPPVLVEVIKRCLTYDPRQRPSTTDLLQSPLLPKLEDPFLMAKVKSIVTPEMWLAINGNCNT